MSLTSRVTLSSVASLGASVSLLLWVLSAASAAARPSPVLPAAIPAAARDPLVAIARAAHVSTRVDAVPFAIRREIFEYLLDHPAFATHVTRMLRVARFRIERRADGLFLDDGWGTKGHFWVIYSARGLRVMRARGAYHKAWLPTIAGEAVTVIEYALSPLPDGRSLVRSTVTGFLKLDNPLAALVVRVASGIAQRKADKEARNLMRAFAKVSRRLDEDPLSVLEQLRQRPDVPQRELEEFARLITAR